MVDERLDTALPCLPSFYQAIENGQRVWITEKLAILSENESDSLLAKVRDTKHTTTTLQSLYEPVGNVPE